MNALFWANLICLLVNVESVSRTPVYHSIPVSGRKAMVTSDAPICSELGANIMKKGGNAIDAAVTTTLCQGLVYPFASGIGGGGYMLVYQKGKKPEFINFRETAPKLANETMFKANPEASTLGGLSVGIPGEVKGLELAHQKYGKLPWSQLVEPVVKLAIDGFEVPPLLTIRILENLKAINASEGLRQLYLPNGQILQNGTLFTNPQLGGTLKAIMDQGSKVLYEGSIAESIIQVIKQNGGILCQKDLKNYQPYVVPAINSTFRGHQVFSIPPPGSGPVLLASLNIYENFPSNVPYDSIKAHRIIETMKHAYSFRLNLGDPKFVPNVNDLMKKALSKEEAAARFQKIKDDITFSPDYYTKKESKIDDHGTSHVNVLDENGLAVAVTSTINTPFGSKVLDGQTGILLNNQMDDFSSPGASNIYNLPPSESNFIRPGKIPQSSMVPTVVTDIHGNVEYLAGASGGSLITSSVFQILVNLIDEELSVAESISAPRIHHQLIPNEIQYEPGWSQEIIQALKAKNHTMKFSEKIANAGVIAKKHDRVWGASDFRKISVGSGY